MWSANIIKKDIDVINQAIIILVRFSATDKSFDKKLVFGATITLEEVKRRIKQEITRLEQAEDNADILEGAVDLTGVTTDIPQTQAELDKQEWFRDFERLKKVQELINLSVLTGNEAAVTTLKNKVTTNFKAAYIADM